MTMLTHNRGLFERIPRPTEGRGIIRTGTSAARTKVYLVMVKRFCTGALMILLAGGALAAIMALKIAVYLPRFIHP